MKKSLRSLVVLSALAVSTLPSFAAMGGGNPRPQWPPQGSASTLSGAVAAALAFVGL